MSAHTPGPWLYINDWPDMRIESADGKCVIADYDTSFIEYPDDDENEANARLIAAAPELLEALHEGRRAIGDHFAPNDCYATGPMTGDEFRDLVQCPACSFIAMYDAAIAKAKGGQS